jgi:hypothetical protein
MAPALVHVKIHRFASRMFHCNSAALVTLNTALRGEGSDPYCLLLFLSVSSVFLHRHGHFYFVIRVRRLSVFT